MSNLNQLFKVLVLLVCSMALVACGKDDETNEGSTGSTEEFSEGVPGAEMMATSFSETATTGQNLEFATLEGALTGQPSEIRAKAEEAAAQIKDAVADLHALADSLKAQGTATEFKRGLAECVAWEMDSESVHWKLSSCKKPALADRFVFLLQGRPVASTADADYLVVAAGEHGVLARQEGKQMGAGRAGYNLDNRFTLTGKGSKGKAGIGYRAAGRYRHLSFGIKDYMPEGDTTPRSAKLTFTRVVGKGGNMRYASQADFVTMDANSELVQGQDGTVEKGRATISWRADGAARTAAVVCGGTVGDGKCVRVHQCWQADKNVAYEEISENPDTAPIWEQTTCPSDAELPVAEDTPPTEAETEAPAEAPAGEDSTGLLIEEPAADPALEAAE